MTMLKFTRVTQILRINSVLRSDIWLRNTQYAIRNSPFTGLILNFHTNEICGYCMKEQRSFWFLNYAQNHYNTKGGLLLLLISQLLPEKAKFSAARQDKTFLHPFASCFGAAQHKFAPLRLIIGDTRIVISCSQQTGRRIPEALALSAVEGSEASLTCTRKIPRCARNDRYAVYRNSNSNNFHAIPGDLKRVKITSAQCPCSITLFSLTIRGIPALYPERTSQQT